MNKPFHELTAAEAKKRAKDCTRGAMSVEEVRRRLTDAGFNGAAAAVAMTSHTSHGMTMCMFMVMVHGPNGQTISC